MRTTGPATRVVRLPWHDLTHVSAHTDAGSTVVGQAPGRLLEGGAREGIKAYAEVSRRQAAFARLAEDGHPRDPERAGGRA